MTDRPIIKYPITIVANRYGGAYEGGVWGAFHLYPSEIPDVAAGDDIACATWWDAFGKGVGAGGTPDKALTDLLKNTHPLKMVFDHRIQQRVLMRVPWGTYAINREHDA